MFIFVCNTLFFIPFEIHANIIHILNKKATPGGKKQFWILNF